MSSNIDVSLVRGTIQRILYNLTNKHYCLRRFGRFRRRQVFDAAIRGTSMRVTVYGPLRSATGEKTVELAADPETVADAVDAFVEAYPRAERHLVDCDGDLRSSVRIAVDGESAAPDDSCSSDATLTVHPAMRGG
jgi:molybdopterin synthase sulfur carrier subunit